jgi:hypothetical protein
MAWTSRQCVEQIELAALSEFTEQGLGRAPAHRAEGEDRLPAGVAADDDAETLQPAPADFLEFGRGQR